jgi:DNA-binding MarR family transcriptional regulator
MPQAAVLRWVARSPGCGVRDIAKGLHVTPPTISVGVRRLVEDGWLEQRSDPHDRRARPLYPTEKGQQYLNTLRQHHNRMLRIFLSGLSPDEQETLINLLGRAIAALEEAQGTDN